MNKKTAKKLETLRKQHDFSQDALADKLGVTRQAVSKWESGESSPDTDHLIALAKLYNITIDELIDNSNINEDDLKTKRDAYFNVEEPPGESRPASKASSFPFPVLVVILYLFCGFVLDCWHPAWLLFLTIPLYYIIVSVVTGEKKAIHAVFPILITGLYLAIGLVFNLWHPTWLLFFLIPLYYLIIGKKTLRAVLHAVFPIMMALVFLALGFFYGLWHPGWMVFLAIPLWSWAIETFLPKETEDEL
jgi:transcriptional regulator with XRE-family HTH domain